MSQHVLSTFAGEAAQAAVEAVVLLVYSSLLHTRLNNILLGFHLSVIHKCQCYAQDIYDVGFLTSESVSS